jgi:hypothetical protein
MRNHIHRFVVSAACLVLVLNVGAQAQTVAQNPPAEATVEVAKTEAEPSMQGSIWPSLIFGRLTGGPAGDLTHYIERYGVRTGFGSDPRKAFLADVADVSFVYHDGRRDLFTLDRRVLSRYNQRGMARLDNGTIRVTGAYGVYRQGAGGLDYLYSPLQVSGGTDAAYTGGNVGYLGRFHNVVTDQRYAVTRMTYQAGVQLKPAVFNDKATVGVTYRGQDRSGRSPDGTLLGGGDVLGTNADQRAKLRWHGYESTVDQSTNELVLNAALRPNKTVNVEYELGYERFRNNAAATTFADIAAGAGIPLAATAAAAGASGAVALAKADIQAHFLADTNLLRQSLVASAGDSRVFVTAGGGWSHLTQETFTTRQTAGGFDTGNIGSTHLFATLSSRPSKTIGLQAYARRSKLDRDIDVMQSTRTTGMTLYTYGAEMDARLNEGRVNVTPGWTRRTASRDLEFLSIVQTRSLYRADSTSDEVFLRARFKVSPRMTLRVTPSLLWSDKTALPTEPTKATKMNVALSYANATGTSSVSGFYTLRNRRNDELSFTGSDGGTATQDRRGVMHQFGVTGTVMPADTASAYASYAWSRDEFRTNFFGSTARRYDTSPVFYVRENQLKSLVASHSLTFGTDVMPVDGIEYGVSYSVTRTAGDVASGTVFALLPSVDGRIENWYHSASVRVEADLGKSLKAGISYLFDYYSDASYTALSGGLHTVMASLGYRF